jgi:peptide/nickel transport system substrate-binding protein
MTTRTWRDLLLAGAAALAAATMTATAGAAETLRVVMHSDLKVVDPIWTTAYISRNHGYMIYDTLFAMDENFEPKPQMVDTWTVSDDKLVYTFTLRDGLKFHDGAAVTAEDAVASLKRWGSRDTMGQLLMSYVKELAPSTPRRFRLTLSKPYGLVLLSLAKPSSNVPFVMPKRVAETPGRSRSRTTPAPARSCSRPPSGSPAPSRSTRSSPTTSRGASRRPGARAARW